MMPPHDLEAESATLSAIMLDRSALDLTLEFLKPEHFYSEAHSRIFEAACSLSNERKPVDVKSVGIWLNERGRIAQVGGMTYLTTLLNETPSLKSEHVEAYARKVAEKWRVRTMIATCQRVAAEGYLYEGDAKAYFDQSEQAIYELSHDAQKSRTVKLLESLKAVFKQYEDPIPNGIKTGFDTFDMMTSGLHAGDLTIVAARPGMGKTSLALNFATNVAAAGKGVLFFSMEMPTSQVTSRAICTHARVDVAKVRSKKFDADDWRGVTKACKELGEIPLWVDDTSGITVNEIRAKIRRRQSESDLSVVFIDYLQLMRGAAKTHSREQEISEISRSLKGMAKELNVAVVALSQLNRSVENRQDKRPMLSDLRESGAIEQDADNIAFIYREDYYEDKAHGEAEIVIAKQRNGPLGVAKVGFEKQYTRFHNLRPEF